MGAKRMGNVKVRVIHDTGGQFPLRITDGNKPCDTIPSSSSDSNHFKVETDITRFAIGKEWAGLKEGEQSGKFFSLQRASSKKPCQTIQASHGNLSTAGVTHPTECRKFTIAELKRICAFPDDFILTGSYSQQWERLGNSVPPVMMLHVAEVIRDGVLNKCADKERQK